MTRKNLCGRSTSQGMIGRAKSSDQKVMITTTTFELRDRKIIKTTTIDHNMPDKVVQDVSVYFSSKPMTQAGDIQSNR